MEDLLIRSATERDIPAILRLYHDGHIDDGGGFTVEEAVQHFAVLKSYPYFQVFMAVVNETVAGTYELVMLDNMAQRGRKSGIVEDVAVHPDHQGHSVGREMMQRALD